MENELTEQEIEYVQQAFDAAVKASPDAIAAASVLGPILAKLKGDNQTHERAEPWKNPAATK